MNQSADFSTWLAGLRKWHGWLQLSAERAYHHSEEEYNRHYGVTAPDPSEGEGLCRLLSDHKIDTSGPALEIGCGTGFLTHGVARHYPGPHYLITDPSPTFLRLTHDQFPADFPGLTQRHYAVLNADDLGQLPDGMFSVIALRSTLHHILNVEAFIADAARALRPGGALVMGSEPVESGHLLMAAVAQSIPNALKAAGIAMEPAWTAKLDEFTSAVQYYCNRDLDKTHAEDKHLFSTHELSALGTRHNLALQFFPTATFRDFAPPFVPEFHCFSRFFLIYLEFCMRFEPAFMEQIRRHLMPQLTYIDECYRAHRGPAITGVFLLKKNS